MGDVASGLLDGKWRHARRRPGDPLSPYLPQDAKTDPYPFSVPAAITLLKQNGWTVHPGGTDVCAKAGTGGGQCGAGLVREPDPVLRHAGVLVLHLIVTLAPPVMSCYA
jgi:hypothetical protein